MAVKFSGDFVAFTVGSSGSIDLTCEARNVDYSGTAELIDGSCLTNFNETPQEVKRSAKLSFTNLSTLSPATRVSHYDLTGLSVSGISVLLQARGFTFTQDFQHEPIAGIGSSWTRSQVVKRKVSISLEADVLTDGIAQTVMTAFHSGTYANRTMTFSMVINGVTVTLPTRLAEISYSVKENSNQTLNFTLQGLSNDSDALFSAAPSGYANLFAWSITQPATPLDIVFTPSTDNFSITGQMLLESVAVEVKDADLLKENYSLVNYGTMTATAN